MGVANRQSIAWAIAKSLHLAGAQLAFTYENKQIQQFVSSLVNTEIPNSYHTVCDVTTDEKIRDSFAHIHDHWGRIDGVIHSISYTKTEDLPYSYLQTSRDQFTMSQDIGTYSLVAVAREVKQYMYEGGTIVTLTHMGSEKVLPHYHVMGAAKAALESSVRYLANELGPANIRINAISAGPIRTSVTEGVRDFDYLLSVVEERAPLRRGIDAEEVGDAALFLCSYLGRGITGEILHVDGGYNIIGM
ncbi:SDR family oxidoreductase [Shimazuella sp. AN120528]|nr:SDR family oxidoreductase [Shimazuella soli]